MANNRATSSKHQGLATSTKHQGLGCREYTPLFPPLSCLYGIQGAWKKEECATKPEELQTLREERSKMEPSVLGDKLDRFILQFTHLLNAVNVGIEADRPGTIMQADDSYVSDFLTASKDLEAEFVRVGAQYHVQNPDEVADERIKELDQENAQHEKAMSKMRESLEEMLKQRADSDLNM